MTAEFWAIVATGLLLALIVGACCWDVERLHKRLAPLEAEMARLTEAEQHGNHARKRGPA